MHSPTLVLEDVQSCEGECLSFLPWGMVAGVWGAVVVEGSLGWQAGVLLVNVRLSLRGGGADFCVCL
ncbi:unnamed protein product, partial [Staurois parvus]